MYKKFLIFSIIFFVIGVSQVLAANFLDAHTNNTILPDQNITIWGGIYNVSNTSLGISGENVTATLSNGQTDTKITLSDGTFNFSLNTTGISGPSNLTVVSGALNKLINFKVSNISTLSIQFVENLPPFSVGSFIIAKVTSTDTNKQNQTITGTIYSADGKKPTSWGVNSSTTDNNGIAYLNFSIPSTASAGRYVLSIENGAGYTFFVVRKYTVTVKINDIYGSAKAVLSPTDNVTVETKIVDSSGNLKNVTSVTCDFIDDVNNLVSIGGTRISDGTYQCNYTTSSAGQSYNVKVTATDGSITEILYTQFATQSFSVRLSPKTGDFFRDFGGRKSFTIGQMIQMDIMPTNVSTGETLVSGTDFYCNTTSIKILDVWFASNGTSVNSTVSIDSLKSGMYMMQSSCYYEFNLGQLTGVFGIKVNLTVGSQTMTGQGYFSINKYLLKVEPATMFGGMDFHVLLKPEENATFKLSAYNLTDGSEMPLGNITYAEVYKITPLTFTGIISESSSDDVSYTYVSGSNSRYLNVLLPASTGPQLLTALATVAGENVTGEAFYIAKYIMGFAGPTGSMFEEGPGGGEDVGGGGGAPEGGAIACTAGKVVEFSAQTMDASTMQAVKGVTFQSILEAREEETGRDVSSCFSSTKATSDNQGQAKFNLTFGSSCNDLSGPYFIMFNVSWKNNTDMIPAFFMCKNLNFWANTDNWDVQPDSTIIITVTNASYANQSTLLVEGGNVTLTRLFNFNPSTGGQALTPNTNLIGNIDWTNNVYNGTIQISPQNFSIAGVNLTKWPNGFFDGRIQVCDNRTGGLCDSNFFGFGIMPFRSYTTWWQQGGGGFGQSSTYVAGQIVNTSIYAQTNVSNYYLPLNITHQNSTHHPGFTVKIMDPKSQTKMDVTGLLVTNATNDWDNWGVNEGWKKFNITFTLPNTVTKGWYMGFITINNTNGETVDQFIDFQIKSYTVGIPHKEKLSADGGSAVCCMVSEFNNSITNMTGDEGMDSGCQLRDQIIQQTGWSEANWTYVKDTFGITPDDVNLDDAGEVCVHMHFNVSKEDSSTSAPNTGNTNYGVLVFGNSTHKMLFMKNSTNHIFQLNPGEIVPGTKQYLMSIEGPWYVVFVNATNTATRGGGQAGFVQEDWGWAGQYEANKSFSIPFIVIRSNQPQPGMNVTIENMVELETEGFGVRGMVDTSQYQTFGGNVTDSNGIVFVMLNVSKIGKFKPFWKLNSTSSDVGGFDKSPVIDVIMFKAYGQMVNLLPQTSKVITLNLNITDTYGNYGDFNESYYNGSFMEEASNQFYIDNTLNRWYFLLSNSSATTKHDILHIDNDTTVEGNFYGSITLSSTSEWMTSISGTNIGLADYIINNSNSNKANVSFFVQPSNMDQFDVLTNTQKVAIKLCAEDLQYLGMNSTINLTWVNWMGTMGPPTPLPMTLYNISTGEQMSAIRTSSLNNGCVVVEVRPKNSEGVVTTWGNGLTEIQGLVTQLNATGHETANRQQIWAGQVRYWSGTF